MSFTFDIPTTSALAYGDYLTDPAGGHAAKLANATATRGQLGAVLKQCRRTDEHERDWASAVKATEEYLPWLLAMMQAVETDMFLTKSELVFTWRSTLSSQFLRNSVKITLPSFHYELVSCLLTLSLALSNLATSIVTTLGPYERQVSLSDEMRKVGDEKINSAAALLCKASGVLRFLSENEIPAWEAQVGALGLKGRPPQMTSEITRALSDLALADAERLAIRRSLSRAIMDIVTTPGPPLPKSHPSPALLSKLFLNVLNLYSSTRSLTKSISSISSSHTSTTTTSLPSLHQLTLSNSSTSSSSSTSKTLKPLTNVKPKSSSSSLNFHSTSNSLSPDFRNYCCETEKFIEAVAFKWLGVDSCESNVKGNLGIGIAWLLSSRLKMKELQKSNVKLVVVGSGVEKSKRKSSLEEEIEWVEAFLQAYQQLNQTVMFETVPSTSTLQSLIPTGRSAFKPTPFTLPNPAFPTSTPTIQPISLDQHDQGGVNSLQHTTHEQRLRQQPTQYW